MATGAYAIEQDYSHYVAQISKTIYAVVGTASKGPIGVPTVCTGTRDLINKFGPLMVGSYGLYAAQYYLSQSSKLYYVRVAGADALEASATLSGRDSNDDVVDSALVISTLEKGTYGNGYTVTVSAGTTEGTYDLLVRTKDGISLEAIKGISMETLEVGYTSNYVKVTSIGEDVVKLDLATATFKDGNNGADKLESGDYITAATTLRADTVDMNLFTIPGVSDADVIVSMLTLAEAKGDCFYLIDAPKGLTKEGVVQWVEGGGAYQHAAFNSSYGAVYYDWVTIYDSVNKVRVQVPPSVVVAATYAYSDRTSELWFAPAGLNRGIVRGALDVVTKLDKVDVDALYEKNINCIYEDPQVGLVLWGQKTLHQADTALDRINVRRMLNYLKRVIVGACNYLTFEPNDGFTWSSFEMKVKPVLESVKNRRGIYEYQIVAGESIVTDEDIDNYRMPCKIVIRPTKVAEEIPIYFTITSTGADFNDILGSTGI